MADTKTYTTNYNLVKPGQDDFYNVDDFNSNADKIDAALHTHKTGSILDHPDNSVTDTKIGNRTITDTVTATTGAGTITNLLSKIGNMIKRITGKANWYTAPAITLEDVSNHTTATSGAHAASAISSLATGDVAATNVQAAIVELASEKAALSGATFTGAITGSLGGVSNTSINSNAHGAIELGDLTGNATVGSLTPFIDWHYALGSLQDFNVRQTNHRDGAMQFTGTATNALEICCYGLMNGVRHGFMLGTIGSYGYLDYDTSGSQVRLSALNNLVFGTNSNAAHNSNTFTEYMRLTAGKVGIGTPSPAYPLHVAAGTASAAGVINWNLKLSCLIGGSAYNGVGTGILLDSYTNNTLSQPVAGISSHLNEGGTGGGATDYSGGLVLYSKRATEASPTGKVWLHATGSVGVGTKSPAYNLDVIGNINASTGVYSNGVAVAPGGYGLGTDVVLLTAGQENSTSLKTGRFFWPNTIPGSPTINSGFLFRDNRVNSQLTDEFTDAISNSKYFRSYMGGVWSAWKQIATTDLIPAGAGAVKAHVNFSYSGGVITIRNSFNVSSVVRTSGGQYTINFAAPLASANYTVQCTAVGLGTGVRQGLVTSEYMSAANTYGTKTANAIAILTVTNNDSDTTVADVGSCNVTILQ